MNDVDHYVLVQVVNILQRRLSPEAVQELLRDLRDEVRGDKQVEALFRKLAEMG